jgi:hypothetical protein
METLDLSVPKPAPTAHLKLGRGDGAWFIKKTKDTPQGNAWQIGAEGDGLQLKLTLPYKHGATLILEMCRTTPDQRAEAPVVINVNGDHEWGVEIDPHNLNFHRQSWYLPHYMLEKGKNLISLKLAPEAGTEALVRSVSVMRFDLQMQQQSNWCWAAVTTSLLNFFDPDNTLTQCQVVKECFSQTDFETETDCCRRPKSNDCNRVFKLVDALDSMGLLSNRCNYPLSLDEIREQIQSGAPVALRIEWKKGGGHFVLITAIGPPDPKSEGQTWLRVSDPKDQAASYITYNALKTRYKGNGKWTHTYLFERERARNRKR